MEPRPPEISRASRSTLFTQGPSFRLRGTQSPCILTSRERAVNEQIFKLGSKIDFNSANQLISQLDSISNISKASGGIKNLPTKIIAKGDAFAAEMSARLIIRKRFVVYRGFYNLFKTFTFVPSGSKNSLIESNPTRISSGRLPRMIKNDASSILSERLTPYFSQK